MDKLVVLDDESALTGVDLTPAFVAAKSQKALPDVLARFRKKEDVAGLSRSILRHRMLTLTGRNTARLEEEMGYKPSDPNEIGMNIAVMRRLAHFLILQACNKLPATAAAAAAGGTQLKRKLAAAAADTGSSFRDTDEEKEVGEKVKRMKISEEAAAKNGGKGRRRSLPTASHREVAAASPSVRKSRRSVAPKMTEHSDDDASDVSIAPRCPGPSENGSKLAAVTEEADDDDSLINVANPTPAMRDLIKKRQSLGAPAAVKAKVSPKKKPKALPPPAPPKVEFPGALESKCFVMAGNPEELDLATLYNKLPIAKKDLPGFHACMLHTPAEWSPIELHQQVKQVKMINAALKLDTYVVLVGTGIHNAKQNMETLERLTAHVQLVTFHNESANLEVQTGKLRETTTFFLAAYFFPGCEQADSRPPAKCVADGHTTCFRAADTADLEKEIVECFTEEGEWVLDLYCGKRELAVAAARLGRNAVAVNDTEGPLDDLAESLAELSTQLHDSFRPEDGIIVKF